MTQDAIQPAETVKTPDEIFCAQLEAMGFSFRESTLFDNTHKARRIMAPAYYKRDSNYRLNALIENLLWRFQDNCDNAELRELCAFYRYNRIVLHYCFQPNLALKDPNLMAIYESKAKLEKITDDGLGVQTIGKPGKMIKKILPFLDESSCTWFAEQWKELFSPVVLNIVTGKDKESFAAAYVDTHLQTKCLNPYYGHKKGLYSKSLSGSCMRYDFGFTEGHPATVYASGDFESIYATDQNGKVAARVVVNVKQGEREVFFPGPVYTNSDQAFDTILAYLVSRGYDGKEVSDYAWQGAKLLAIKRHCGGYIMPYVDLETSLTLSDCGKFWTLGDRGERPKNTNGYIYGKECVGCCAECNEDIFEDDVYQIMGDSCYCESCTDSELTYCEGLGEYVLNSDSVTVYEICTTWSGRQYRGSSTYSQEYAQNNFLYSEIEGEFFKEDSVTYSEELCDYIPNDLIGTGKDYMVSSDNGELYESGEMVELPDGNWIHHTELDTDEFYLSGNVGDYKAIAIERLLPVVIAA